MYNNDRWNPVMFHRYQKVKPENKKKRLKLYACHTCKGKGTVIIQEYEGFKETTRKGDCISCGGTGKKERFTSVSASKYYALMKIDRQYAGMKYRGKL